MCPVVIRLPLLQETANSLCGEETDRRAPGGDSEQR